MKKRVRNKSASSKNELRHQACKDKGGTAQTENIISLPSRTIVVGWPPPLLLDRDAVQR